jgi:hypothetical protein
MNGLALEFTFAYTWSVVLFFPNLKVPMPSRRDFLSRSSLLALSSITFAANRKRLRTGCAVPDELCKFKGRLA